MNPLPVWSSRFLHAPRQVAIERNTAPLVQKLSYAWWNTQRAADDVRATIVEAHKDQALRAAAREIIRRPPGPVTGGREDHRFVVDLLGRTGDLRGQGLTNLRARLTDGSPPQLFIHSPRRVMNMEELQNVQPGKLVAFVAPGGGVRHVMVSIGDGWFAGARNNTIKSSLGPEASLVTAEEFGPFGGSGGRLVDGSAIETGYAAGATVQRETLRNVVAATRDRVLLGTEIGDLYITDAREAVIRAHGAPFNVNNMDAIEVGHLIRGVMELQRIPRLQSLHLIVCWSGADIFGRNISTGQVLADFLNTNVTAYRHTVTPEVSRRPASEGKVTFHPRLQHYENLETMSSGLTPAEQQEKIALIEQIGKDRLRHMWWHNLSTRFITAIGSARGRINRRPRSTEEFTGLNRILHSIVALVVGEISASDFIRNNQLSATDIGDFYGMLEETGAGLTDEQCLSYCIDILTSRQAWMNMVPTVD